MGDDREKVLNCFGGSLKKLEEVKKKAKEGLGYYERLEKLSRKKNVSDQELAKVLKKISKVNRYMESDYMARTVMDSLEGLNYTLRPIAYQMQADKAGELMDVAEQGKVLLYGVTVAADEISDIAEQTIVKYAEEHPVKDNERQEGNKNGT